MIALLHLPQNEGPARMRSIVAAARKVAKELEEFEVDEQELTAAEAAIKAYEEALPDSRAAIVDKGSVTAFIPGIMKRLRLIVAKMKALAPRFKDKSPVFVEAFKRACLIVDAGGRHEKPEAK